MPEDNKTLNNAQNVISAQNVTIINNYGAEPPDSESEELVRRSEEVAPGISDGLRSEVARFAVAMEKKLMSRDHLHPNGWAGEKQEELLAKVANKFVLFHKALSGDTATVNIREIGADIANLVMMLVDNAGALKQ